MYKWNSGLIESERPARPQTGVKQVKLEQRGTYRNVELCVEVCQDTGMCTCNAHPGRILEGAFLSSHVYQ